MLIDQYPEIRTFAFLPERALDTYRTLTNDKRTQYEILQAINAEYISAASEENCPRIIYKNGNTVLTENSLADRVCILTNMPTSLNDSTVVLSFVPNRNPDKQPWEMQNAISETEFNGGSYVELGNKPREMLFNYAFWSSFVSDLKTLKNDLALYENWSFKENPDDNDFPILKNYISYTFAKLWQDKQVAVSINGRYSVFNTGLVNRNYQYIYILFEKNVGSKPWKFSMFCIPGIRQGGRILSDNFKVLPKPAHYFSDISDISYIIENDKTPDQQMPDLQPDHYFIDNPKRLPQDFLLDGCRKNKAIIHMLKTDISGLSPEKREAYWRSVGEAIGSDPDVYDDLEASFRNAVRKAVMRVSWNYRTAIPVYFPTYNKMSILLPLSFGTETDAEVALVVERNNISQKYTAPTILSLPVAYSNARLVCKPESDWLNQRVFEPIANANPNTENDTDTIIP